MPASIGKADVFSGKVGRLHKSHYAFKRRGESGLWVSDLFPELAGVADELTVINSMVAETANHIPGIFQANTGFRQMGFPSMGSWLSYGLGTENESLPSFVVLPDARGIPNAAGGAFNWTSGFLPAEHQGVAFNTRGGPPIRDLQPAGGASPRGPARPPGAAQGTRRHPPGGAGPGRPAGGADPQLRAGRADAGRHPRGDRFLGASPSTSGSSTASTARNAATRPATA